MLEFYIEHILPPKAILVGITYALFATFEIAPEYDIDVYKRIAEKARQKIKEKVKTT